MRDLSRPALLIALGLLFVLLTSMGPGFFFGISLSGLSRWFLIGLLIYFAMNRCGGRGCGSRCCCKGTCSCDEDEDDA
ncbi:MAG: hypothetical protein ACI9W4_002071 [Rhodothermales bacterium]|jgi:hypothetical protein